MSSFYSDSSQAGWVFYKSLDSRFLPLRDSDLTDWIVSYSAALAEYPDNYRSIQDSLLSLHVPPDLVFLLLDAADSVLADSSRGWLRWPSVPVRNCDVVDCRHRVDDDDDDY